VEGARPACRCVGVGLDGLERGVAGFGFNAKAYRSSFDPAFGDQIGKRAVTFCKFRRSLGAVVVVCRSVLFR